MKDESPKELTSIDDYARRHCERTAEYATIFARALGLPAVELRTLRLAGLLHRVGRFGIPDDILRKAGPLSADEFEVVKHQLNIAAHLIVDVPNSEEVRKVLQYHHERWDGGGYPLGLKGAEIPFLARVLAIADAFSAITLDRAYRGALPHSAACAELNRVSGTQLDPRLAPAFVEVTGGSRTGAYREAPALPRRLTASYTR